MPLISDRGENLFSSVIFHEPPPQDPINKSTHLHCCHLLLSIKICACTIYSSLFSHVFLEPCPPHKTQARIMFFIAVIFREPIKNGSAHYSSLSSSKNPPPTQDPAISFDSKTLVNPSINKFSTNYSALWSPKQPPPTHQTQQFLPIQKSKIIIIQSIKCGKGKNTRQSIWFFTCTCAHSISLPPS